MLLLLLLLLVAITGILQGVERVSTGFVKETMASHQIATARNEERGWPNATSNGLKSFYFPGTVAQATTGSRDKRAHSAARVASSSI